LERRWTTCTLDPILETLTLLVLETLKIYVLETMTEMLTVYIFKTLMIYIYSIKHDVSLTECLYSYVVRIHFSFEISEHKSFPCSSWAALKFSSSSCASLWFTVTVVVCVTLARCQCPGLQYMNCIYLQYVSCHCLPYTDWSMNDFQVQMYTGLSRKTFEYIVTCLQPISVKKGTKGWTLTITKIVPCIDETSSQLLPEWLGLCSVQQFFTICFQLSVMVSSKYPGF